MCEFCVQHGEGKRWYLNARNYSQDLSSDLRRRRFVRDFLSEFDEWGPRALRDLERLRKAPAFVQALARWGTTRRMKKEHYGQILPIEEVEQVLGLINSVVRVPCVCRQVTRGKEVRYCFAISVTPSFDFLTDFDPRYKEGPDASGLERVPKQQALSLMRDFEGEGIFHSAWTFLTPFIGAICNCDRSDCLAMISSVSHDMPTMFKGHALAVVDWDKCTGCRACMRQCQFGAIGYSAAASKCSVDQTACYGCGVCRSTCPSQAISLAHPAAAEATG